MEDKKVCKQIIKRAKKHPDWYTPEEVLYAKAMKKQSKKKKRNHKMSNISDQKFGTPQDWEDFWYSPEKFGTWHITDFEKVWKEMDEIEPLTPVTQSKRKD